MTHVWVILDRLWAHPLGASKMRVEVSFLPMKVVVWGRMPSGLL
jgi:hypothetical protein